MDIELPSQRQYLAQINYPDPDDVLNPAPGEACGICLVDFPKPVRTRFTATPSKHNSKVVVHSKPCRHLFHYECIQDWYTSIRPERNTCPNCRRELFIADPLTPEQIRQMQISDLRDRIRARGEVCVAWEHVAMDATARELVDQMEKRDRVSLRRRFSGRPFLELCKMLRDAITIAVGPFRPAFEPHKETFVLLVLAVPVLLHITRHKSAYRTADCQFFLDRLNELLNYLGQVRHQELYAEMLQTGLFDDGGYRMGIISRDYVREYEEAATRVLRASSYMQNRSGNNGVLSKLGGYLARTVPLGLVPEHYNRDCETPLTVLQKITGDEHPVLLTYTNQGSVETVRVQG